MRWARLHPVPTVEKTAKAVRRVEALRSWATTATTTGSGCVSGAGDDGGGGPYYD